MKPKPPKPIWCAIHDDGVPSSVIFRTRGAAQAYSRMGLRIIRYIPAPPPKRRKPRRKGYRFNRDAYRAGGMS